jgi:hypothetical protein
VSDSDHPRPFASFASDASTLTVAEAIFSRDPKIAASRTRSFRDAHAAAKLATAEALCGVAARGRHARKHVGFDDGNVSSSSFAVFVSPFHRDRLVFNSSHSVSASGTALDSSYNTSDAKTTSNPFRVEEDDDCR